MDCTLNKTWNADAPANIALIKYMGKTDTSQNLPLNPSISFSLENCRTFVEIEQTQSAQDLWEPLDTEFPIELSYKAQQRFLQHADFLKTYFNYEGNFLIRSGNNFPSDCGLASSASSFAALTKALCEALAQLTQTSLPTTATMAELSRKASGSSCRSFYSPWCLWENDTVRPVDLPFKTLLSQVIIVDAGKKSVSSSQAHTKVATSALFNNRKTRAEQRLQALIEAFKAQSWRDIFNICWQEFWDMHALFETSAEPFGYMTPDSLSVLNSIRDYWQTHGDGPIVTMDAGANVHCLYRPSQQKIYNEFKEHFEQQYPVIEN